MKRIEEFLLSIGGHASNRGFTCIVEAYNLLSKSRDFPRGKTMKVYQDISEKLGISKYEVERGIRHEITRIYNKKYELPDFLTPDEESGKLTNKEFLFRLVRFVA